MKETKDKEYMTSRELCELLKVSKTTLTAYNNKGLPKLTLGRTNRYILEEVLEWFDKRKK